MTDDRSPCGGVVLELDASLCFVPASVAVEIAGRPRITPVPGSPPELLGIALHAGVILAVLAIGSANAEMLVCRHAGELVGLLGGRILRAGSFDAAGDGGAGVEFEGRRVSPLDLVAVWGRIEAGALAARRVS
jgi:hypothetical protein